MSMHTVINWVWAVAALWGFIYLLRPLHPARIVIILFIAFIALSIAYDNGMVQGHSEMGELLQRCRDRE